jgi:hypothetical protein
VGDPHRVDGVGLRPLQIFLGEATRPQRVEPKLTAVIQVVK